MKRIVLTLFGVAAIGAMFLTLGTTEDTPVRSVVAHSFDSPSAAIFDRPAEPTGITAPVGQGFQTAFDSGNNAFGGCYTEHVRVADNSAQGYAIKRQRFCN